MLEAADAGQLTGANLTGASGERIGTITEVRSEPASGRPAWVRVEVGFSGGRHGVVPLFDARKTRHGDPWVPYTKAQVLSAPFVESLGGPDGPWEQAVLAHYGVPDAGDAEDHDVAERAAAGVSTGAAAGVSDGAAATTDTGSTSPAVDGRPDSPPPAHRRSRSGRRTAVLAAGGGLVLVVLLAVLSRQARPLPPLRRVP